MTGRRLSRPRLLPSQSNGTFAISDTEGGARLLLNYKTLLFLPAVPLFFIPSSFLVSLPLILLCGYS